MSNSEAENGLILPRKSTVVPIVFSVSVCEYQKNLESR